MAAVRETSMLEIVHQAPARSSSAGATREGVGGRHTGAIFKLAAPAIWSLATDWQGRLTSEVVGRAGRAGWCELSHRPDPPRVSHA